MDGSMMEEVETVISSLAHVRLQAKSRLLRNACCPDKDLVVLVSRSGNEEKLSLWKIQGSKKWEVDMDYGELNGEATDGEISALNWSPDGIASTNLFDGRRCNRLVCFRPNHCSSMYTSQSFPYLYPEWETRSYL